MINDAAKNRLYNWKFNQAVMKLDDQVSEDERSVIESLSRAFGDSGWFQGDVGNIVGYAVEKLTGANPS